MKVRSGRFSGRSFKVETTQRRFSFAFGKGSGDQLPRLDFSAGDPACGDGHADAELGEFFGRLGAAQLDEVFKPHALLHEEFLHQGEVQAVAAGDDEGLARGIFELWGFLRPRMQR
jgi:hypothetical protein